MPSSGTPIEDPEPAPPSTPPQNTTRALLQSLEELRDSLSVRVAQLASAVERLRIQAGQLEEGLGVVPPPGRTRFSGSLLSPQQPANLLHPAQDMPLQFSQNDTPLISTSAIATEVAQLDRPITSAEIHRLLDRASQSLSETPDLRAAEMEGTLDGLREVRNSLQGGIRELTEVGETQSRLRQRMRARWDGTNRPIGEGGVGDYIGGSGPIDSKERESVRRIAEIKKESEDRRKSPAAKARRARMEQMEWEPCPYVASGTSSGLPPTNTKDAGRPPTIVRTSGVTPPPARPAVPRQSNNAPSSSTTAAAAALAHTRLAGTRSAVSHLDAASLDAIHAEIAQLDLNLEPDEYMDGLSRIIRRALLPPGVAEDSEAAEALLSTLPGWGPPSPLSSSSSSSSTAIGDARDAGLTYRGRDVRDRLRESTYTLPSGRLPADMPSLQQAREGLRAIMYSTDRAGTAGATNNHVPPDEEIVEAALVAQVAAAQDATSALEYADQLARLRADRRERVLRAREIVIELARPRQQNTARSARELVDAATVIREDRTAGREARASERHAAYEVTVRAELRAAQAHRIRAFNRYQELVASRARRETRGPAQPAVPMPRPPTGRDIGTDAIITVIPVLSPTEREDAEMDEDMARQSFIAAQMREAAVQQRLLSAQNRLRVMTSVETSAAERLLQDQIGSMAIASDQREQPNRADAVSGRARPAGSRGNEMVRELAQRAAGVDDGVLPGGVGWASATRSARRTVGPRGEEPEDVDTLVRMRHLQETRPGTPERIEARRRNLAAIRQDLVARRRTHEAQRLAAAENVNTGADAGTDPSIQQLLLDAQHVNEARRSLYETLEQDHTDWEVTPSSPITATGNADYSHIQVSVGTSTESDEEFFRRRDETLRRAGYELHPAVMGVSGARVVRIGRTDLEETGRELLLPQPPYQSAAVTPVAEPRASSSSSPLQSPKAETAAPTAPTLGNGPDTEMRARTGPTVARPRRRERVYISLLDL